MASPAWGTVFGTCASVAQAVSSASRSAAARGIMGKHVYTPRFLVQCRRQSALASKALNVESNVGPTGQTASSSSGLPEFRTLEDVIHPNTLKAITVKPFNHTHMSPVQAEVLPLLPGLAEPYSALSIENTGTPRDLLVRAKTGTGKTMAFLVPAIEARLKALDAVAKQAAVDAGLESDRDLQRQARLRFARDSVGALIISPTRELATQIATEAQRLTHHHNGFEVKLFTGGSSKYQQLRDWSRGTQDIIVATPGRLRDVLQSDRSVAMAMSKTQLLILDEADTLLDMGFRDDIEDIKTYLPPVPERQTFLFSATVSPAIQQIARSTLAKNHKYINCVSDNSSPVHAHIEQYHTVLPDASHQIPHTLRLLAHDQLINPGTSKSIVFLPTTKLTQLFATLLRELSASSLPAGKNTRVYEIHSKRTQQARTRTSDQYRKDSSGASILVTSDVSARGVDYPGVTRVIQVGAPGGTEQYVHRVGRTGRAGTGGRGDLVLLPYEAGFVTWQLTQVKLKPLTLNELVVQTKELAAAYDADSRGAISTVSPPGRKSVGPGFFKQPVTAVVEDIDRNVLDLLPKLDVEAVHETFLSLLGYYVTKTAELRTQKEVVIEGLRAWATEACGLSHPPYVSPAFLARLGITVGHGGRGNRFTERAPSRNAWQARVPMGSHARSVPSWQNSNSDLEEDFVSVDRTSSRPSSRRGSASDSPSGYGSRFSGYGGGAGGGGYGGRSSDWDILGGYGGSTGRSGYSSRSSEKGGYVGRRGSKGGVQTDGGESGYGIRR